MSANCKTPGVSLFYYHYILNSRQFSRKTAEFENLKYACPCFTSRTLQVFCLTLSNKLKIETSENVKYR